MQKIRNILSIFLKNWKTPFCYHFDPFWSPNLKAYSTHQKFIQANCKTLRCCNFILKIRKNSFIDLYNFKNLILGPFQATSRWKPLHNTILQKGYYIYFKPICYCYFKKFETWFSSVNFWIWKASFWTHFNQKT